MKIRALIEAMDDRYDLGNRARVAWLILKHRPFIKCPLCKGVGGGTDYYGEGYECRDCWGYSHDLENYGADWFVGRVPFWAWVQSIICTRLGFWEKRRIRDAVRCRIGWHQWMNDDQIEPGRRVCSCCYSHKGGAK